MEVSSEVGDSIWIFLQAFDGMVVDGKTICSLGVTYINLKET